MQKYTRKVLRVNVSYSFRTIPMEIAEKLGLKEGQETEWEIKKGKIVITPM